jgi:hypothetical protein
MLGAEHPLVDRHLGTERLLAEQLSHCRENLPVTARVDADRDERAAHR